MYACAILKILSDVDDGLVPKVIERAVLRVSREFVGLSSVNHGSFSWVFVGNYPLFVFPGK